MQTANSPEKLRQYRMRMRASGLRPVQLWAWDTRSPALTHNIRQQCQRLKGDPAEAEAIGFGETAASLIEDWK